MKVVATKNAPAALGPYSQGYVHGGIFYSAGQLGLTRYPANWRKGSRARRTRPAKM